MSLQLHLHPPIMTRGQGTQEEPDEFPYLNVEFLYLIKRAATPSFHSNLPRNKEREEHILRLLLLKTTTCPSRTLLDPTCRYYFAYYSSSLQSKLSQPKHHEQPRRLWGPVERPNIRRWRSLNARLLLTRWLQPQPPRPAPAPPQLGLPYQAETCVGLRGDPDGVGLHKFHRL